MTARKKPDVKKLQQEVDSFNRRFAVGDPVDYLEVIEEQRARRLRTRTPAQILSGHTAVVWLVGKSGCVCCSHCFMPSGVAPTLPPHLRDDAPTLKCTTCGRKSWDVAEQGQFCNMPQPGNRACNGIMQPAGVMGSAK